MNWLGTVSGTAYTLIHWGWWSEPWESGVDSVPFVMAFLAGVMNGLVLKAAGLGDDRWAWRCWWVSVVAGLVTGAVCYFLFLFFAFPMILGVALLLAAGHGLVSVGCRVMRIAAGWVARSCCGGRELGGGVFRLGK